MISITFTAEQDAAIVAKWNEHAAESHQLSKGEAYLVVGDSIESDIEEAGSHTVEVRGLQSKNGNPVTFEIFEKDVTVEEIEE